MDNPQHYQPLSHALHPPLANTTQPAVIYNAKSTTPVTNSQREEEEEGDDDDEGLIEEQLNPNELDNQGSNHSSPGTKSTTCVHKFMNIKLNLTSMLPARQKRGQHSKKSTN
jgi:hypothetical protein